MSSISTPQCQSLFFRYKCPRIAASWMTMDSGFLNKKKKLVSLQLPSTRVETMRFCNLRFDRMQPSDQELEPHLRFEFDDFVAREALLDEEYWTAASLRAESEWENGTFKECGLRYNENYRKKFVDKEFNDIKTRCKEQDGESSTCIITVWKEEKNVKRTVIQSVVGTLDLNIRNLMLEEVVEAHDCSIINRTPLSKYGYIANLCVAKSARRMGIATKMLYFAVQRAKSNGVARVYAHVDRNNTPAQILFHNLGFEVVGLVNPLLVKNRMCLLRFEM